MNCCIGDFKHNLCDCNNGFCKEFKSIGREEDFFDAVMQRIRPQGWIPCSERLPSKGVAVLVNGTMYDAPPITISTDAPYYYEQGWINAWMPLPKPWEGAE